MQLTDDWDIVNMQRYSPGRVASGALGNQFFPKCAPWQGQPC
jgi:hypothetical protein